MTPQATNGRKTTMDQSGRYANLSLKEEDLIADGKADVSGAEHLKLDRFPAKV